MWFPCLSVRLNTFLYVFENLDFLFDNVLIKVLCPFSCWGICHFLFSLLTVFMFYEELTHWKDSDAGRDWGQEKGTTEDEMAGWHHGLDGRESEWTPGVGDGQGGLAGCDSWGRKESDTTERLNWTDIFPATKSLQLCPFFATLWTEAPLSVGFSRQEHWTGLPCPFPLRMEVQFSSVAQSCPILCDSMNRSPPGLPVHHQLPEFTQTHVHRVSDAIQPSHLSSSRSPPAPNPSQHQSLFQWVNSSHEVAKVLELQL